MTTSEELGKRIRSAREEAGLSQQELGRRLNPPRSHAAISDMERGVTRVGATDIAQIATIVGKLTSDFLAEQNEHRAASGLHARGLADDQAVDSFKKRIDELLKKRRESP